MARLTTFILGSALTGIIALSLSPTSPCRALRQSSPPANWHKIDVGPFSIFAPPAWQYHQLQGIDSFVGEFVGDGVTLKFDFGPYSGEIKEAKKPAYVVMHKTIGGFRAKIVIPRTPGHNITGVYFRDFGFGRTAELCLWGEDLTSIQQELALDVFETIRFGSPPPR